jgi:hypothetical protein
MIRVSPARDMRLACALACFSQRRFIALICIVEGKRIASQVVSFLKVPFVPLLRPTMCKHVTVNQQQEFGGKGHRMNPYMICTRLHDAEGPVF